LVVTAFSFMAVIPRFIGPDGPERPSVERMRFDYWTLGSAGPDRAQRSATR
jgi:hypothetical protein